MKTWILAGLACGVGVVGQQGVPAPPPPMVVGGVTVRVVNAPGTGTNPVGLSGQRAAIDPKTGKLRPVEHDEAKQLNDAARALVGTPAPAFQQVVQPSGAVSVSLGDHFMEFATVARGADGKLAFACEQGEAKSQAAAVQKVAAKGALDEK